MTSLTAHLRAQRGSQSFRLLVVGMCLVVLSLLAVAQVTHLHPNQSDADHCQLCIVMHTLVPITAAAAVVVMVQVAALDSKADPVVVATQRQFRLFIRPPPVSC